MSYNIKRIGSFWLSDLCHLFVPVAPFMEDYWTCWQGETVTLLGDKKTSATDCMTMILILSYSWVISAFLLPVLSH